jgi:hypothetical protein
LAFSLPAAFEVDKNIALAASEIFPLALLAVLI